MRKNPEKYYNEIDVYVLASTCSDSFPTVNLEAMLYKKPVIAVNIGGSKEQVVDGKTGFIIESGNPKLLAEKILFLYKKLLFSSSFIHCLSGTFGSERSIYYYCQD